MSKNTPWADKCSVCRKKIDSRLAVRQVRCKVKPKHKGRAILLQLEMTSIQGSDTEYAPPDLCADCFRNTALEILSAGEFGPVK